MAKRRSLAAVAGADYTPVLVEHRGGDRYTVTSYVDAGPDTLRLQRISYTCDAVRIEEDEWRINTLKSRP